MAKELEFSMSGKMVLLIGRWQPVHSGHETLVRAAIEKHGFPALVYVRDIPPNEKNPFTSEQTKLMLEAAFADDQVKVIIGPDIGAVCYGRGVGYAVEELVLSEDVQRISATAIRQSMDEGGEGWREYVCPAVAEILQEITW